MAERIIKDSSEFFEILDDVKKTWWVTIGYVAGANVDVPKVKRKNPDTGRMKGYPDYTPFKKEGYDQEIGAMVSITSYNFQFFPTDIAKQKYVDYKNAANEIRRDVGIPEIQDKENDYTQTINYGRGISAYGGANAEKMGHTYTNQNTYDAKISGVTYLVSTDGSIIRGLSNDEVKPYLKAKREIDGVAALKKINAKQEVIDDYIARIKDLKYKYKRFEASSILWMVATTETDHEKILYFNDRLQRAVDGININPEDFLQIAKQRYASSLNEMLERRDALLKESIARKKVIRLTESDLRKVIVESVKRILREDTSDPIEKLVVQSALALGYRHDYSGNFTLDGDEGTYTVPISDVVMNLYDSAPENISDAWDEDDVQTVAEWLDSKEGEDTLIEAIEYFIGEDTFNEYYDDDEYYEHDEDYYRDR